MKKEEIEKLFYIEKNYSRIKELQNNSYDIWSFNILGKIELYGGNIIKAHEYFNKSQSIYGCCYCKFLMGNISETKKLLNMIKGSSPLANWLICLIDIIENSYNEIPTYFQIRNFYEQDLNMILKYKNIEYFNKLIAANNYLEHFNKEIYKYTGKVLLYNAEYEKAKQFLLKSLDIFFKDSETHFLLGELYEKKGNLKEAKREYKIANEVNNGYFPAIKKLKDLGSNQLYNLNYGVK